MDGRGALATKDVEQGAMPMLRVMKFGGTSVASAEARAAAVARVSERHAGGDRLVVVVSAMGRRGEPYATDTLLDLCAVHDESLAPRELDAIAACGEDLAAAVLASELIARGLPAVSLRGFQAGIITDGVFQNARIQRIESGHIRRRLDEGRIVVVTGFQGVSPDGDITTLGRGGSDTSAVALGVALGADVVDIFTDVDGIYSADPRVVPEAQLIPVLPYHEAAELAHQGARVLHPRAAEIAERHGIPVRIRSTFSDATGTLLRPAEPPREGGLDPRADRLARAVTSKGGIAQVAVSSERFRDTADDVCALLDALAEAHLSLDMINVLPDRLVFTVPAVALERAAGVVARCGYTPETRTACAKVTLVGGGIHGVPGVVARMARLLHVAGVRILQSVDSSTLVSVLVAADDEATAVRALHAGFLRG
jgi:aspartate kinase